MKLEMEQTTGGTIMKKNDPRYIEATIKHSPSLNDPLERKIVDIIKSEALTTSWAREAFRKLKEGIILNWEDVYSHLNDREYVHNATQKAIAEAAEIINTSIVSGEDNLKKLKRDSPFMIASNHLSTYKLVPIMPEELRAIGVKGPLLDVYYPYIAFISPFYPVTKKLNDNIYEAAVEAPGELEKVFTATGSIDVAPASLFKDRISMLTEATKILFTKHPNAGLVIFPEGGATGKRSGKGIYDLEQFKTGSFLIASKLSIPILPVAQYFNPQKGFEIGVFEPITPKRDQPKEYYQNIAESTRKEMQTWLNQRKNPNTISNQ